MTEQPLHSQLATLNIDPSIHDRLSALDRLTIIQIDELKNEIELELEKNFTVLNDQNLTLESPLLTRDGYPRSDIDVLQMRIVKRNINMLRNDLSKVINACTSKLHEHFHLEDEQRANEQKRECFEHTIPFARISDLIEQGPMAASGCSQNDEVVLLGELHAGNYLNLQNISKYILQNENRKITMKIKRKNDFLTLFLVPNRNWGGQGLLGCKLKLL